MVKLQQDSNGNYRARKRLPDDVREEYGRLHGARHEAKFFALKNIKGHEAKQRFGEWLAEVESRIAAIRALRDGTGQSLTNQQARALAGEWYDWFLARHRETASAMQVEFWRDAIQDAIKSAVASEHEYDNFDDLRRVNSDARDVVRPVVADIGETAQFLAMKRMVHTNEARNRFLDFLYDDLAEALKRLERISEGHYGVDTYRGRFPKTVEGTDSGITPWELFTKWIAEREPARSTIESWRYPFQALSECFKDRTAASIMPEEADAWVKSLITPERSASTVKKTWLNAATTVFRWALEHKHIPRNPFAGVKVTVPKKKKLRERTFRA
jgi:hypothetical protein